MPGNEKQYTPSEFREFLIDMSDQLEKGVTKTSSPAVGRGLAKLSQSYYDVALTFEIHLQDWEYNKAKEAAQKEGENKQKTGGTA